jgi:hypothetical protein
MTLVRLREPYGSLPRNANVDLPQAAADELVRTFRADLNTAAGATYVPPVEPKYSVPVSLRSDASNDTLLADQRDIEVPGGGLGALYPSSAGSAYMKMLGETLAPMSVLTDVDADAFWDQFGSKAVDTDPTHRIWGSAAIELQNHQSSAIISYHRVFPAPRAPFGVAPVLSLPVYIPDYTKVNGIAVYLLMDTISGSQKSFTFNYSVGPNGADHLKYNGQHVIRVGAADWVDDAGRGANWATHNVVGWTLNYFGTDPGRIIVGDWRANQRSKSQIMLIGDAAYQAQFDVFRPLANALGLKMSFAVTSSLVGVDGFMSLAQLKQCVAEGHGLMIRPNRASSTVTQDQYIGDVRAEQFYLQANFGDAGVVGSRFLVYPNGQYWPQGSARGDSTLIQRLRNECGIVMARTTDTTNFYGGIPLGLGVAPPNLMIMPILGGYSNQTIAGVNGLIDVAVDRGDAVTYFGHGVNYSGTTGGTDLTPDFLRGVFEHIADLQSKGLIQSRTVSDFYAGL